MTSSARAASIASPVETGTPACRSADVILSTTPPTTSDPPMPRFCARAESAVSDRRSRSACKISVMDSRAATAAAGSPARRHQAGSLPPMSRAGGSRGLGGALGAGRIERGPCETAATGIRIGWVVDEARSSALDPSADVWMRGERRDPSAAVAARRTIDARPATTSQQTRSTPPPPPRSERRARFPVFGPAPVGALVALLRDVRGKERRCASRRRRGEPLAEAHARLAGDPDLRREAEAAPGLVGTLEHCQQTVAVLYAAGMRELRLRLPATAGYPGCHRADVDASAATPSAGCAAGSPRSPAPAAPTGWGGRA